MKALVLAGGAGTRLRPITHTSAKQLVPVGNKPILDYGLESIRDAGITDVGVIVGETRAEIEAYVGDGSRFGLDVTFVHQPQPLGLAHAVLTAEDYLGADDFVMYLGDNLVVGGITDFVDQFRDDHPAAQILLSPVKNPSAFGIAELNHDGAVIRLLEKPERPPSDLALVGVYLFSSRIFDAARAIRPSARGELEITDAIQWLITAGDRVHSQVIDGWWAARWKDTGQLYDLLEANRIVLESVERRVDGEVDERSEIQGRVVIEPGAELVNSVVRGPAIIGTGTRLVNTFVGPYTAIAQSCVIEDSEIEHCVILECSTIRHIRPLVDSLIGRHVQVGDSERKPLAYRLMLGDHSRLSLT